MDCDELSKEQLETLKDQMGRSQQYFRVLKERMEGGKFPYNDELRQRVEKVCDALHSLWVSLHYMSCKGQTGQRHEKAGELQTAYRIQTVMHEGSPMSPQFIQLVEAETPLEAIAKLARQGYLTTADTFFVRVILDDKIIHVPMWNDLIVPAKLKKVD